MILSLDKESFVRFFPRSVNVGALQADEKVVPHCSRSPLSVIAAPKLLSSLISRINFPSKKAILLGVLTFASSESGATTRPNESVKSVRT